MRTIDIAPEATERILEFEEGHFLDLKDKRISPAKLTETVSSFANTAGGEVYVGVSEGRKGNAKFRVWDGFADMESANGVLQALEALSPLSNMYIAQFLRSSKHSGHVLHLIIQKTKDIIEASNGIPYIRRGAQKLPVSGDEALKRLRLDKGIVSFEDETISLPLDAITNSVSILEFVLSVIPSSEPEEWLRSQFLIVRDNPTVAGVLLFSEEPQAILPKRSGIKIYQYRTREEGVNRDTLAFDPITIEGPIYRQIFKAVEKTKEIVESIRRLGDGGLEKVSYPHETLHEIITNAVLHRDYSVASDIHIRIYDNRIEVESPGKLPGHVTVENILREQFARNPKLVRLINKFPNPPNKDVGEGLNTAFEAMRKLRLKEPIVEEREATVLVNIQHTPLSSPAQLVMEYLESHADITNQIGREITGLRRDVQMKDIFVNLRKQGLLEQVPGKRGRASAWRKTSKLTHN